MAKVISLWGTDRATVQPLPMHVFEAAPGVRILMIGNRQATRELVRQLDVVTLEGLEPFGRVRLGHGSYAAIGRHRETCGVRRIPVRRQSNVHHVGY
jgi:hypothetical protein